MLYSYIIRRIYKGREKKLKRQYHIRSQYFNEIIAQGKEIDKFRRVSSDRVGLSGLRGVFYRRGDRAYNLGPHARGIHVYLAALYTTRVNR